MPIVNINGVNLHYHVAGRGVPVVFIHPPLLTASTFNYQKTELASACKVITFDIRGHGRSGRSEAPLTYELIAEDVKQLLDHLDISQALICGYSAGGGVALQAMLQAPDRYMGGILLSAMSEVSDWWLNARLAAATISMRSGLKKLVNMAVSWGNRDSSQTFRQLSGSAAYGDARNIAEYYAASKTYACTRRLQQIKQPMLLVYGQKDRSFYRYAEILHHHLPNSSLYFMRNVGHQLPTKAGDRLNRLLMQWLKMQAESRFGQVDRSQKAELERTLEQLAIYGNEWNDQELVHSSRDI